MSQVEHMDEFLQEEVRLWSEYMLERVRNAVRTGGNDSGDWLQSLAVTAAKEGLQRAKVELSFRTHGRMADMGAGKGYRKGVYIGRDTRTELHRGRKGSKVYSRTAYGSLRTLMNNVANKYVQLVPELLKKEITNGTDQN